MPAPASSLAIFSEKYTFERKFERKFERVRDGYAPLLRT
jgi:hypothetical protein